MQKTFAIVKMGRPSFQADVSWVSSAISDLFEILLFFVEEPVFSPFKNHPKGAINLINVRKTGLPPTSSTPRGLPGFNRRCWKGGVRHISPPLLHRSHNGTMLSRETAFAESFFSLERKVLSKNQLSPPHIKRRFFKKISIFTVSLKNMRTRHQPPNEFPTPSSPRVWEVRRWFGVRYFFLAFCNLQQKRTTFF